VFRYSSVNSEVLWFDSGGRYSKIMFEICALVGVSVITNDIKTYEMCYFVIYRALYKVGCFDRL